MPAKNNHTSTTAPDYYPFGMPMPGMYGPLNSTYRFGFNGKENDNEVKGFGNSLDFGARIYDPRIARWMSVDPLQIKYPNLSPYQGFNNNPNFYIDIDGEEFFAYSKKNKKQMIAALKTLFGEDHGFSFNKNKLVYSGNSIFTDKRKEYIMHLFLKNVVNNSNNHVHLKSEGTVVGAPNYFFSNDIESINNATSFGLQTFDIPGERTITVVNKNNNTTNSTIFLNGNSIGIGEYESSSGQNKEIIRNVTMLLWHGIGHSITNYEFSLDFQQKSDAKRIIANQQTVGFENLIAKLIGLPERDGTQHGHVNVIGSSGINNRFIDEADTYYRIKTSYNSGSGIFSISNSKKQMD